MIRDEDGYYITIKGSILQEDIILKVSVCNSTMSKYIRYKVEEEMDKSSMAWETSTPVCRQWMHQEGRKSLKVQLTCTAITQLDLIGICRLLHAPTAGHAFFSSSHGRRTSTDHLLSHKDT